MSSVVTVVGLREVVLRHQRLVKMLDREIPVARVEQRQNLHHRVLRNPASREFAKTTVVKTFRPVGLEPIPLARERPLRHAQYRRRVNLTQLTTRRALINFLKLY